MAVDVFAERLAKVRHRFMSTLAGKIEDTYTALPRLSGDGPDAAEGVAEAYRRIHNIVGVGASVGFIATGRTAGKVESILFLAQRARRGLNSNEFKALKSMLHILRDTAQQELQSTLSS